MSRERVNTSAPTQGPQPRPEETRVHIPDGTFVELEAAHAFSPYELKEGDAVSFRVALPLTMDGVVLIAAGAVAVGVVTEASGGRGRHADITLSVKEMTTPDDATLAVRLSFSLTREYDEPDEHDAKAAALMFPVAPLALTYGLRRRPCLRIPARGRCHAFVRGDVPVRTGRDKKEE